MGWQRLVATFVTGWRRCIGCLKLLISFHQRATNYGALLRKMTYTIKTSYRSSPPCRFPTFSDPFCERARLFVGLFCKRNLEFREAYRSMPLHVVYVCVCVCLSLCVCVCVCVCVCYACIYHPKRGHVRVVTRNNTCFLRPHECTDKNTFTYPWF